MPDIGDVGLGLELPLADALFRRDRPPSHLEDLPAEVGLPPDQEAFAVI